MPKKKFALKMGGKNCNHYQFFWSLFWSSYQNKTKSNEQQKSKENQQSPRTTSVGQAVGTHVLVLAGYSEVNVLRGERVVV